MEVQLQQKLLIFNLLASELFLFSLYRFVTYPLQLHGPQVVNPCSIIIQSASFLEVGNSCRRLRKRLKIKTRLTYWEMKTLSSEKKHNVIENYFPLHLKSVFFFFIQDNKSRNQFFKSEISNSPSTFYYEFLLKLNCSSSV